VRRLLTFALSLTASATVLVALPTITTGPARAPSRRARVEQVRSPAPTPATCAARR
jgi:hypothetical protein